MLSHGDAESVGDVAQSSEAVRAVVVWLRSVGSAVRPSRRAGRRPERAPHHRRANSSGSQRSLLHLRGLNPPISLSSPKRDSCESPCMGTIRAEFAPTWDRHHRNALTERAADPTDFRSRRVVLRVRGRIRGSTDVRIRGCSVLCPVRPVATEQRVRAGG